MPYNPDRLYGGALTTTTTAVLATAAAGEKFIVKQALFCNTTASDITVTMYLGGFRVASSLVVPAGSTVDIPLSQVVRTGETIAGGASSAGIDCLVAGVRVT